MSNHSNLARLFESGCRGELATASTNRRYYWYASSTVGRLGTACCADGLQTWCHRSDAAALLKSSGTTVQPPVLTSAHSNQYSSMGNARAAESRRRHASKHPLVDFGERIPRDRTSRWAWSVVRASDRSSCVASKGAKPYKPGHSSLQGPRENWVQTERT